MTIGRIFFGALLCAGFATAPHAGTCSLMQMASLDMTIGKHGVPEVPVTINGTTYSFTVDTAGIYSKISDDLAQKLGLRQSQTNQEIYSVRGMVRANSVDIASLKLGDNEAKHFHLMVGSPLNMPKDADGVLAGDLLMLFDVEFDFAKGNLNLFSPDHCPGKVVYWTQAGYAEIPFHLASGPIATNDHIDFDMTLDGHDLVTEFDTGSTWTWIRHKAATQVFSLDDTSPGMRRLPDSPDEFPNFVKQFNLLQIGGVAVNNPEIEIITDHSDDAFRMAHSEKSRDDPIYGAHIEFEPLTLGMNVIRKLHVYIAYKEHKLYVTGADVH
jgi:hypothetical protein